MIFFEYIFLKEVGSTDEFLIEISLFRDGFFQHIVFSGSTGEDIQQYAYIGRLCCFVNTDAYLAAFEVAKVHLAFQSDFTQCIYRNMSRQFDLQRIEVILVQLSVT